MDIIINMYYRLYYKYKYNKLKYNIIPYKYNN